MARLGLERTVVDAGVYERTVRRFREAGVALPTLGQLRDPATIPAAIRARLREVDPDARHPLNLFRVHWFNAASRRGIAAAPEHVELPPALTGVRARVVLALGDRFPMIHAHKVLAAYGCLVPRVVTGQFDPTRHRAIWPSTGNYCRGGVAISRIMNCHGVAILPEGMSKERFSWLERWVGDPVDITLPDGVTTTTGDAEGEILETRPVALVRSDVESALAAINTAYNQVSSDISLAQAGADQKLVQSKTAVEIETLKAQAEVEPLNALAAQLTELKSSSPDALRAYVRNVRLKVYGQTQHAILEAKS